MSYKSNRRKKVISLTKNIFSWQNNFVFIVVNNAGANSWLIMFWRKKHLLDLLLFSLTFSAFWKAKNLKEFSIQTNLASSNQNWRDLFSYDSLTNVFRVKSTIWKREFTSSFSTFDWMEVGIFFSWKFTIHAIFDPKFTNKKFLFYIFPGW